MSNTNTINTQEEEPNLSFYNEITKKNIGVYSNEEQSKLKNSRVVIFGLGGVGGLDAILCARTGILNITGVDPDYFELSNINRQMIATIDTLNQSKSFASNEYLKKINPLINANCLQLKVTEDNVHELIRGHDIVLEALDDMPSRIIVHRAARELGVPSVAMSGSPPHRGFVASFTKDSPSYEEFLNLPTIGLSMTDSNIISMVQDIKKERARYSVKMGAPESWAQDFCDSKVGWIITPIRASLLSSFSCHEVIQILLNKPSLATAPKAIIINLDDLSSPVKIVNPEDGKLYAGML